VASIHQAMAEGFDFVAMGRALIRDPALVGKLQDGTATRGSCIHCNKCMVSIYSGTRCVLDHPRPLPITSRAVGHLAVGGQPWRRAQVCADTAVSPVG